MQLRPYQAELIKKTARSLKEHRRVIMCAPTGSGKCLGKGTPVLMYNGSIKPVELIKTGDLLMGPDSKPRKVLSICKGREMLYKVKQKKGYDYVVNESHILSLKQTNTRNKPRNKAEKIQADKAGEIKNISVKEYLDKPKYFKHIHKGWKVGVDFKEHRDPLLIDPYFLGVWLGDGSKGSASITTMDKKISDFVNSYADKLNLDVRVEYNSENSNVFHMVGENGSKGPNTNPLMNALIHYNLKNNKHIPHRYKTGSRDTRLKVLAGLIDTDGSYSSGFDIVQKNKRLADDIEFIARSLGFAVKKTKCRKTCTNNGVTGTYYRLGIYGDLDTVPTKINRKKASKRKQIKDHTVCGIELEKKGVGDYYGFELEGPDRLFLLGDFTVTHNTVIFSEIIRRHLKTDMFNRVLVLTHRTELFSQSVKAVVNAGTTVTELKAGMKTSRTHAECRCLVAMVETMKRRDLTKFGEFTLIIIDEAHRAEFKKIIQHYSDTYIIGATATPISASKKDPLKNYYNDIVESATITSLIEGGYLATPRHFKAKFDGSGLRKKGGEFTSGSQFEALDSKVVYENLVSLWRKHAGDMKTIVFNVNKEHTLKTTKEFQLAGVKADHILSGDKKRDEKIEAYRNNEIQVLLNCDIATTGFDIPDIQCVVVNRSTASLPLWLQMVGRGSRTAPDKTEFTILDFGGNIDRHGMWHSERDWKDIFWNPGVAGENPAPHRECEECGWLMFASIRICPGCGAVQPTPEQKEAEKVRGYLEEVGATHIDGAHIDDLSISDLYHLEKTGKYKPSYIARVARTRGEEALAEYAKMKGYSKKWLFYQNKLPKGYNNYRVRL